MYQIKNLDLISLTCRCLYVITSTFSFIIIIIIVVVVIIIIITTLCSAKRVYLNFLEGPGGEKEGFL
jgi:hypothetical protein